MTYPGGKNGSGVYQKIINQIPPHETYIEACAGSAAIARYKVPANTNILLEVDEDQCRSLKDEFSCDSWHVIQYNCLVYLLQLRGKSLDHKDTFIYIDPPYPFDVRRSQRDIYNYEWDISDHQQLMNIVGQLNCRIAISSYKNVMYNTNLSSWRKFEFTAQTRQGTAIECLYMNYPEPAALHDYRYLGENYTDRQRIKRKAGRWVKNLDQMPLLERKAVLSAIQEKYRL